MNLDRPSAASSETPKPNPVKPAVADKFDTFENLKSKNDEQEAEETSRSDLGNLVMDHWDGGTNPAMCFGVEVSASLIPDEIVDCLAVIETDYELDLAEALRTGELQPADVGDMLVTELETRAVEAETDDAQASLSLYKSKIENLHAEGKTNTQIILTLTNDPAVPETERTKLHAFAAIIRISAAVPADKDIIRTRINQINAANGFPDPITFARSFIFDAPTSHLKSGISDTTQNAIASELGIVRQSFVSKTGGDINDIYQKGIGTKMVRDQETGELREESAYLGAGQDVEIREGQYIGLSDANEPIMKIIGEHTYTSDLPANPTDHDMTMYGITTQWIAKLNDVNMAEIFFPHSMLERGGGHIDFSMPEDFQRAQRLSQIFFGAMSGYDGQLLDQSDLDRIPYLMQFQNEKGDAVIGDVNPDQMRADYQRQNLIDEEGALNWKRFEKMVEANRNGLFVSEENFAHAENQGAA